MEGRKERGRSRRVFRRMAMQCLCSGEQANLVDELNPSNGEIELYAKNDGLREAELSLQEGGSLNYEEARALLAKVEYQQGHVEEALRVLDGINTAELIPMVKMSICRLARADPHSSYPPMSLHTVNLVMETIYLKTIALRDLGKFKEAAQECSTILDVVESALPKGLPAKFGDGSNLNATIRSAVELLPELWKLADFPPKVLSSYRGALLSNWNLDAKAIGRIQKEFAIFLLYSGCEACTPPLRSQLDGSFVPRNNLEEAILLLMILLMKFNLKRLERDPTVMHHLTFALSLSGRLKPLAGQFEKLLPGVLDSREWLYNVALCYLAEEDDLAALNLLKMILRFGEDPSCLKELLLTSKICSENGAHAEEGASYARRALASLDGGCDQLEVVADLLLGISLSRQARYAPSGTERASQQREALKVLGVAEKKMQDKDFRVLYNLSLENAEQRKLDAAALYAKKLLKLENGSELRSWLLVARITSAQKRFEDAESIVNAALDQTAKWCQGDLLQTKAKIQAANGQFKKAVETYTQLLAVIELRKKSFNSGIFVLQGTKDDGSMETEAWYNLALLYLSLSQWRDTELCISKIKAISAYSPLAYHATGKLLEARGFLKEALGAYSKALDLDPKHVPSLICAAVALRQLGGRPLPAARCLLTDALRLDRTNHVAWFNLGLTYEDEGGSSSAALEAAECFQAAALLEETAPAEPFR
ncbi:protein NPGR2-like isoform X1 [Triticum urartu]|uniref:Tetratricopeptide repeat protein 7B n=2 Tax=Triticum urartu TaxID=4572 RepID=A0A8R7QKP9_TRIUA|nr:protein NPGR2-like isoform X1 [Triticum urartu]XP_048532690.1 protein NPGR2-like isoform X1 [Triticum urartu]